MVASLACVNWVTTFSNETHFQFLTIIKPEVFVASQFGFLSESERVEVSGHTRLVPIKRAERASTTEIINRIYERC